MALKTGAIEKADFVFMFSSVGYDQKTIVKYVYDFFGGAPLSGCSGEGTIAGWETDESNFSVAVMAIRSDELRFTNGIAGDLKSNSAQAGRTVAESIRDKLSTDTAGLFVFPDGLTINFERFKTALENELDLGHLLPLFGGTASDNWQWKQTYQVLQRSGHFRQRCLGSAIRQTPNRLGCQPRLRILGGFSQDYSK